MTHKPPNPKMIVLNYLLAGLVWVFLISWLLLPVEAPSLGSFLPVLVMGMAFIVLTAGILYFLLRKYHLLFLQTVKEVKSNKEQFAALYGKNPQPIWISNEQKELLSLNKAARHLFGPKKSLTKSPFHDVLPEPGTQANRHADKPKHLQLGVHKVNTLAGDLVYLDLVIHKVLYQDQPAWLVVGNDVTRLMQTEKDKRQIHNELLHYKKALDRSGLLSVTDLNGIILDVNNKFCEISKYSREELIGHNHRILKSGYHPPSFFQHMYETIEQGNVWRNELCNKAKDGQLFWVDLSLIPVMDEQNNLHRYMAISYPITDRKAAELRLERVHDELMTFMYKASHNLRGPVATIRGLLNVAEIEVKEPEALAYLQMLGDRARHLEYTLNELIDITKVKQEDLSFSGICFPDIIESVLSVFKGELKKCLIRVEQDVVGCEDFSSDEKLIQGLLYYLIDNAIKFRSNTAPCIKVTVQEKGNGIMLSIADNGPGIDEHVRARIYEMYYRGNVKSTGSGLGLYIVNSIVERLGGYINLQSHQGEGTTFTIFLPDALYIEKLKKGDGNLYLPDKRAADV
jgi:PAS domain S-box-containing protein